MASNLQNWKKCSLFSFLSLFLLTGCSAAESNKEQKLEPPNESTYTVRYNEQQFTVESYEQDMRTFITQSRVSPLDREELHREIVHKSLRDNGISYSQLEDWMFAAPTNLEAFEETLDKLEERKTEIDIAVEEALMASAELLPGEAKTVHILPALPETGHMLEEVGFVAGVVWTKTAMFIIIDPRASIDAIKHTVAHEYHHTIYMEHEADASYDLLEFSILEGKAEAFAKLLYPDFHTPWTEPLTEDEESTALPLFMEHRNSLDGNIQMTFHNGDYAKGIPSWSTYKIGYAWVQDYLTKHPDLSVYQWTKLNQEEFLPFEE